MGPISSALQRGHWGCGPFGTHISHSPQVLGDQFSVCFLEPLLGFVKNIHIFLSRKVHTLAIILVMFLMLSLRALRILFSKTSHIYICVVTKRFRAFP